MLDMRGVMKKVLIRYLFFLTINFSSMYPSEESYKTVFASGISFPAGTVNYFKKAFVDPENFCVVEFADMESSQSYWDSFVAWVAREPLYNRNCCLGQSKDIDAVKKCVDASAREKIILYGLCRGAAACLNYQATFNNPRIAAIVIDSGVFNVKEAYKKLAPKCIGIKTIFPCFLQEADEPIEAVAKIVNKNIKFLVLHSKQDSVVSFDQAFQFIQKCWELGFDAQLITFNSGKHCKIFKEQPDQYLMAVKTLYDKLKTERLSL